MILIYSLLTSNKLAKLGHLRQQNDKLVIKQVQETFQGIREIKIYNSENYLVNFLETRGKIYMILHVNQIYCKNCQNFY